MRNDNPKVVTLIQARLGSTRLPGKVLRPILGQPMIAQQIERVKRSRHVGQIVIATSSGEQDAALVAIAASLGVGSFAGDENDVLDRLYRAAKEHGADVVVRLTADCPLLDPQIVDRCIQHYLDHRNRLDYVSTGPTFADGLDVEVFSFPALERAWKEAQKSYEREHVTVYIWQSGHFRVERLEYAPDISSMRWTVDEDADFNFVNRVYQVLFPKFGYGFGTQEILDLLVAQPDLLAINHGIRRNEGFLKSLKAERGKLIKLRMGSIKQSEEYWARAKGLIPAGTQTLSKGPTQYVDGVAPKYLVRGEGSHVWDVDGNEYIDYPMGLGAILLGYNYPATNEAIQRQLKDGPIFSIMHPLEVEVSELLREIIPCAEMVRFGKNGSDVTTAAVRVARAYTGREKVAHCGYHGWHDWYIGCTTRNKGVPRSSIELQFGFTFNDINSLQAIFDKNPGEIAAVIMEPYGSTLPQAGFLEAVKALTRKNGAVLIFDEVASGFRFHLGGIHQLFGVDPDLACFGKAMANGMPLSALVGVAEVMKVLEDQVFFSFTYGGECLSLASAKATIIELREQNVIPYLRQIGTRLKEGFNRLAYDFALQDYVECVGLPSRTYVVFKDLAGAPPLVVKSLFQQEVIKRGVLAISAGNCMCFSHTEEDIEYTLGVYQEAFEVLAKAAQEGSIASRIEGRPIEPVFRPIT